MTCAVCEQTRTECPACSDECTRCQGTGELHTAPLDPQDTEDFPCPDCDGTGAMHRYDPPEETYTDFWIRETRDEHGFAEEFDRLLARQDRIDDHTPDSAQPHLVRRADREPAGSPAPAGSRTSFDQRKAA